MTNLSQGTEIRIRAMRTPSISLRRLCCPVWAFLLAMPLFASAQTSIDVAKNATSSDLTEALLGPSVWSTGVLPGKWVDTSTQSERKGKELKTLGPVLGIRPQQVTAALQEEKLARLDIIFLEAGNFFGFRKSHELRAQPKSGQSHQEERALEKQIKEQTKEEERQLEAKRVEFKKLFDQYEKELTAALEKFTGKPGDRVTVGRNRMLRSRSLEFSTEAARMRLTAEDDQLIALAVIPAGDAAGKSSKLATVTGSDRRAGVKQSVKTLPNGDVFLDGIPMVNQGSRGYCAIGTLAMICTFYGLQVNIDQLASRAGYKEGDTENAEVIPIYEAAAKEGRLRMKQVSSFEFRSVMRQIDEGHPILVWRYFTRERDAFHHKFAAEYAADPSKQLPDPRKDKAERGRWATQAGGGHASLITGYNKAREEVLFTESWGEGNRNRRMRQEEMAAIAYVLFTFTP